MFTVKFIKSKNDALNVWQRRDYYRFENFLISDLVQIFTYLNPKTNFRSRQNHYRNFMVHFGKFHVKEVNTSNLNFWFKDVKEKHSLSNKTLLQIKCQLNNFFKWLSFEEIIDSNPILKIKISRNDPPLKKRKIFTEGELIYLAERARQFDSKLFYPYLYTLIQTGARRTEVLKLRWQDIDFENNTIRFNDTKNGETRIIRTSLQVISKLEVQDKGSEFIFPNKHGKYLGRAKVQRLMKSFKEYYPMQIDWNYHDLRHSFAYNFLKGGGEMYQLQAILGHKTIQMTVDLYGNLKSKDVERPSPYSF